MNAELSFGRAAKEKWRRRHRSAQDNLQAEPNWIPLLASPQGGVAERSKNIAKHPLIARPGWFSDSDKKENHPGCVGFSGFAIFFYDTATPPCRGARRGLLRDPNFICVPLEVHFESEDSPCLVSVFLNRMAGIATDLNW